MIRKTLAAGCLALAAFGFAPVAEAQNLRIALREDPDILDPTLSRTYVGRIVYMGFCDKLFDINERLEPVPQLATGFRWEDPTTLIITLRQGVRAVTPRLVPSSSLNSALRFTKPFAPRPKPTLAASWRLLPSLFSEN